MSQIGRVVTNTGPGGFVQTLTGNTGGAVPPTAGNINVIGSGDVTVAGTPGTSTLTISLSGTIADSFHGNTGIATPVAGVLNVITANSTPTFVGSGNTLTLDFGLTNLALGSSLSAIAGGFSNTCYGELAGNSLTSGSSNVLIGTAAGTLVTTGVDNVAVGQSALVNGGSVGGENTAIGSFSLASCTANRNTALGYESLTSLVSGNTNIALGYAAATTYTGAESNNIIIGNVGVLADSGKIRIGTNGTHTATFVAGVDGVNVGSVATVVTESGNQLGTAVITGSSTVVVTPGANTITLTANGSGVGSTITGNSGGPLSPTAGNWNIVTANSTVKFAGAVSTETLDFGLSNLALGSSLSSLTSGLLNVCVGVDAGQNIQDGYSNVFMGAYAGQLTTSQIENVAIGANALNQGGDVMGNNVAVGINAMGGSNYAGSFNTAIGTQAMAVTNPFTGGYNIAIGQAAGFLLSGTSSSNILIGNVGNTEDGTIRIGQNGQHVAAYICGIDGVNVGSVAKVVTMASDKLGTATITAGAGISVTASANAITIAVVGDGLTWSVISANQTAVVDHGYFCNKAGTLALALPATSVVGDVIEVTNENTATGVQFTQAANQQILLPNNTTTTLGATGTLTSSAIGDTLKIVCKTANLVWRVTSMCGNWTPA